MPPRRAARLLAAVLLLPAASPAAVFTAGAGGTHATVQQAVNAALGTAGDDEVRIAQGVWNERVAFANFDGTRLDISGGWNAAFDTRVPDRTLTVLDGGDGGLTLEIIVDDGIVTLSNLSLTGGRTTRDSGNLKAITRGDGVLEIADCVIRDGEVLGPDDGYGAGAGFQAFEESTLTLERCEVRDNRIETVNFNGWGAGLYMGAAQTATLRLIELDVHDNSIQGLYGLGAGMAAELRIESRLEVFDSSFADNLVDGAPGVDNVASGIYLALHAPDDAHVEFRRNRVLRNTVQTGVPAAQMNVYGGGSSSLVLGDSVIAGSARDGGLALRRTDTAALQLVNLTLADNAGIDLDAGEGMAVANTLADTVGGDIGLATVVRSRFGGDPGYVDRGAGDYHLLPDAPAVNAGTLLPPAGGLGTLDLDGNDRVRGYRVDQGAYEADDPTLFVDGFDDPQ